MILLEAKPTSPTFHVLIFNPPQENVWSPFKCEGIPNKAIILNTPPCPSPPEFTLSCNRAPIYNHKKEPMSRMYECLWHHFHKLSAWKGSSTMWWVMKVTTTQRVASRHKHVAALTHVHVLLEWAQCLESEYCSRATLSSLWMTDLWVCLASSLKPPTDNGTCKRIRLKVYLRTRRTDRLVTRIQTTWSSMRPRLPSMAMLPSLLK